MKKLSLSIIVVFTMVFNAQAQNGFNIGAFIGIPVADGSDIASFSTGIDANYLFEINEKFSAGPATGYSHSFGDSYSGYGFDSGSYDDFQYIPIAGAGRFNINDKMVVGVDLGYALGINEGNDGGFYFRPLFGYNITDKIQLNGSFRSVSIASTRYYSSGMFGIFGVGAIFNL